MSPGRTLVARRTGRNDCGQVTLWMLAFSVTILFLGVGVSVETWRIVTAWRNLAATADAAAAAGASGIDELAFRSSNGETIQLDPAAAEDLAYRSIGAQQDDSDITSAQATATPEHITVVVQGEVDLFVLGALRGPFQFTAMATADPRPST